MQRIGLCGWGRRVKIDLLPVAGAGRRTSSLGMFLCRSTKDLHFFISIHNRHYLWITALSHVCSILQTVCLALWRVLIICLLLPMDRYVGPQTNSRVLNHSKIESFFAKLTPNPTAQFLLQGDRGGLPEPWEKPVGWSPPETPHLGFWQVGKRLFVSSKWTRLCAGTSREGLLPR